MLFRPFITEHIFCGAIPDLGVRSDVLVLSMPTPYEGIDEVHVHLGSRTTVELTNFKGFVGLHELQDKQHGIPMVWQYNMIVAAGWSSVAKQYVDLPYYMFPWSPRYFTHLDSSDIFQRVVPPYHDAIRHKLAGCCIKCLGQKVGCGQREGWQCRQCGYLECQPAVYEDKLRAEGTYHLASTVVYALSPPLQHLLQCAKAAVQYNGGPKLTKNQRSQLTGLVQSSFVGGDAEIELRLIAAVDAYQRVVFRNGTMTEIASRNIGRLGFRAPPYSTSRQSANACTPHLGVADYRVALSLVDNALETPGVVHWKEECLWMWSGFVSSRIYIVARIVEESEIHLVIGFKFEQPN